MSVYVGTEATSAVMSADPDFDTLFLEHACRWAPCSGSRTETPP